MKKRMRCTFAAFVEKISTQMRRKNMQKQDEARK